MLYKSASIQVVTGDARMHVSRILRPCLAKIEINEFVLLRCKASLMLFEDQKNRDEQNVY